MLIKKENVSGRFFDSKPSKQRKKIISKKYKNIMNRLDKWCVNEL